MGSCQLGLLGGQSLCCSRQSVVSAKSRSGFLSVGSTRGTITVLQQAICRVSQESQWVPVSWVYCGDNHCAAAGNRWCQPRVVVGSCQLGLLGGQSLCCSRQSVVSAKSRSGFLSVGSTRGTITVLQRAICRVSQES